MYDQPAEAQFIQTHTPIPFEELMKAGAVQQGRWDQGVATEEFVTSSLGEIPALSSVTLASGQPVEVGDAKFVEAKAAEFSERLQTIVNTHSDKTSSEYRAQITGLITDLRKAQSAGGVFGVAAANVKYMQELQKRRQEADLGEATHRAINSDILLKRYAERSREGIGTLSADAPILAKINLNERLSDHLARMRETFLSEPTISTDPNIASQLRMQGPVTGITRERVFNTAKNLITTDPELMADLTARTIANGGDEEDLNTLIDNHANVMADIFSGVDMNVSWKTDDVYMYEHRKRDENAGAVLATRMNLPYTVTNGFDNIRQLNKGLTTAEETITENRLKGIDNLILTYKIDPKHIITGNDGLISISPEGLAALKASDDYRSTASGDVELDITRIVHNTNQSILQAKRNHANIQNLRRSAVEQAARELGITPARIQQLEFDAATKAAKAMETETARNPRMSPEEYREKYDMFYSSALKDNNLGKRMNEILKEKSSTNSFETSVVSMPKNITDFMERDITVFREDKGMEWADTEKPQRALKQNERDKISYEGNNAPKFAGFFYDQNKGSIQALYRVFNSEGTSLGTIKTSPPEGAEELLHREGLFDHATSLIYENLFNQISGVVNSYSGTGVIELPCGTSVEYLGKDHSGNYTVNIPTTEGLIATPFSTIGGLTSGLSAITRRNFEEKNNVE